MTEGGVDFSFECVGNSGVLRNAFLSVHEVYSFPFYNTTITMFPNSILAQIFNFKEFDLFEIEEYKKENVKVDL